MFHHTLSAGVLKNDYVGERLPFSLTNFSHTGTLKIIDAEKVDHLLT